MKETGLATSNKYPDEIVLRARELYLSGLSCEKARVKLIEEATKALGKRKRKLPDLPPDSVIRHWARVGNWKLERRRARVEVEQQQVDRVRRRIAQHLRRTGERLEREARILDVFMEVPVIDQKTGEPKKRKDGTVEMEPRSPLNDAIDFDDLMNLRIKHYMVSRDYLRQLAEMVGGFAPKADLDELTREDDEDG